jgi:hypothetical protein
VLLQVIRQYDWERNGHPKMTSDNLDPNIRSWLEAKGFKNHEDILRLVLSRIFNSGSADAHADSPQKDTQGYGKKEHDAPFD